MATDDDSLFNIRITEKESYSIEIATEIESLFTAYQSSGGSSCYGYSACATSLSSLTCDEDFGVTNGCDCKGRAIDKMHTTVIASDEVVLSADVKNAVCYTEGIDSYFANIAWNDESEYKWMYYGTQEGVLINFPGLLSEREDCNAGTYDPRTRPWYVCVRARERRGGGTRRARTARRRRAARPSGGAAARANGAQTARRRAARPRGEGVTEEGRERWNATRRSDGSSPPPPRPKVRDGRERAEGRDPRHRQVGLDGAREPYGLRQGRRDRRRELAHERRLRQRRHVLDGRVVGELDDRAGRRSAPTSDAMVHKDCLP